METITVTQFAHHIGQYLERCARGETFRLTRYGKHLAYVEPHPAVLRQLSQQGRIFIRSDVADENDEGSRKG